jgi:predicted ATP-grasp superfamily ATP-dependent carboligase
MRIFVYEYISAELAGSAVAPSLRTEGRAMLAAALSDLARLPEVQVETLLCAEEPALGMEVPPPRVIRATSARMEDTFRDLARRSDFTLVIAPEFDELLATRSRWVLEAGGTLLGCSPQAVRLAGDKLALAQFWQQCGVPTPATREVSADAFSFDHPFPIVCKPRFGAGSQATFLARDSAEFARRWAETREECPGACIVQPFVHGTPVSVAVIVGREKGSRAPLDIDTGSSSLIRRHREEEPVRPSANMVALRPASQELSQDGRFQYQGGVLPLPDAAADRAVRLALRALASAEGLCGYVGVDLVLGDASDGRADVAIEINPRLTTSYVGLRALAETNLASLILAAVRGDDVSLPRWRQGVVRFTPQGVVATS